MMWEVRNGRSMAFRTDYSLEHQPLCELALHPVNAEGMEHRVCYYWDEQTGWRWGAFAQFLPLTSLVRLASVVLSPDMMDNDQGCWGDGR